MQVEKTRSGPGKGRSGWGRALEGREGNGLIKSHGAPCGQEPLSCRLFAEG